MKRWLALQGTRTVYVEPNHPWENGYTERFTGKFRDECLNEEVFSSELEAQIVVERWKWHYNERRPHSALFYRTPAEVARGPAGSTPAMIETAELVSV